MQTPKIINAFFLFVLVANLVISCDVERQTPKYIPDIKGFEREVKIIRFEQDFFNLDTTQLATSLQVLKEEHLGFTMGFLSKFIGVRDVESELAVVRGYLSYADARYTYDSTQQIFSDMTEVQQQLNELASYYSYYFPDAFPIEKAYTFLSEYHGDRLAILEQGFIGLPLDMALGEGYSPYNHLKVPQYDQRTCNKEHLVAKASNAVAQTLAMQYLRASGAHLIDQMLYEGKIFYLTDILLPSVADSLKFGFSSHQMHYCETGELSLYEHLSKEELIYSSERGKTSKYVSKGPFNPQLDLPGNSGSWLGYKMICSYAALRRKELKSANANLSAREVDQQVLKMVLEETDPQQFLQNYKPPK